MLLSDVPHFWLSLLLAFLTSEGRCAPPLEPFSGQGAVAARGMSRFAGLTRRVRKSDSIVTGREAGVVTPRDRQQERQTA